MQKNGIEVLLNVSLTDKLPIEPIDLSIIMGNLLDNAIEASTKLHQGMKRIFIEIYIKGKYLIIKVANSKDNKRCSRTEEGFNTSKEDLYNHGFGLDNVKKVVEKLNGVTKAEDMGKKFKVNIAIPIENAAE